MIFPWNKPKPQQQAINALINSIASQNEELVAAISSRESRRHGGYQSSNKGLRVGLLMAKEAMRSMKSDYADIVNSNIKPIEHLAFVKLLREALAPSRKALSAQQKQAINKCCALLKIEQKNLSKSQCPYAGNGLEERLSVFKSQRQDYVNALKEKFINEVQSLQAMTTEERREVQAIIASTLEKHTTNFTDYTRYNIEVAKAAYIRRALSAIQALRSPLNQLPGDEGVYELAGLNGVCSALSFELAAIEQNASN